MGKLIEKLHAVGQASGNGMGFFGRPRGPQRASRPAAVFIAGTADESATLGAALENGADGVIITGWQPGTRGLAGVTAALAAREAVAGVRIEGEYREGALKAAADEGASFAILDQRVAARALFEEVEKFDVVATVVPPADDLGLLALRAVNLLPAQAALIQADFSAAGLARLTVADFARLRLIWESVGFPSLVTVSGTLEDADVRTLVQLGADGLLLSAAGASAATMGQQVKALIAQLERTPAPRARPESVSLLTGLIGAQAQEVPGPVPGPGRKPGTPEPDEE
jgi:DNA-binding NarL/FixJ family response regulator